MQERLNLKTMNLYLSKLIINLYDKDVLYHLDDCIYWHKNIMSGFPNIDSKTPRKDLGVLFRKNFSQSGLVIYVQSMVEPNWENKSWIYNYESKLISKVVDSFKLGNIYHFDLLCIPYYVDSKDKIRSFVTDVDKKDWLKNKEVYNGFEVLSDNLCVKSNSEYFKGIGDNKKLKIEATNLIGRLRITNVEKFRNFYLTGVGREKAYGAGMLLLTK